MLAAPVGGLENTLLAGVEFVRQDTANGRSNATFGGAPNDPTRVSAPLARPITLPPIGLTAPVRDRDSELTVFSAYVQDQLRLTDQVLVTAGLRYDRFDLDTTDRLSGAVGDRVDEKVSPRAAITFKPREELSIYLSYAQSFLPQAGDQFLILPTADAAFAPEEFENLELGAQMARRARPVPDGRRLPPDARQHARADPNNSGFTALTGESRTEGFELGLVGKLTDWWQVNAGYTYLDGELRTDSAFGEAGAQLQQLPEHQFAVWNRFDVNETLGLGVGAIHQGEQFASFSNRVVLPDYLRVDAAAFVTLTDRLTLQLNVENLFDADYFPQRPRGQQHPAGRAGAGPVRGAGGTVGSRRASAPAPSSPAPPRPRPQRRCPGRARRTAFPGAAPPGPLAAPHAPTADRPRSGRCWAAPPRTSASLGSAFVSSRAAAAMAMPGVQKPHWIAPSATSACCTGCERSRLSPSIVVT